MTNRKGKIVGFVNRNTVSVIDTSTNTGTTKVPVGYNPFEVAVTPDGSKGGVTNAGDNTVSVIGTASDTVLSTISVGNIPIGVAVTPDEKEVYVTNANDNTVSVIDTATIIHEILNFRASELIGLIMKSAKFFITGTQLIFKQYHG